MPVLGICLGMEILFDKSEEGKLEGLKILDGEVIMLPKGKVKIPHMGWNNLQVKGESKVPKGSQGQLVDLFCSFLQNCTKGSQDNSSNI